MIIQKDDIITIKDFLKSFKIIFWDFDGVIKNSVFVKGEAFEKTFKDYGPKIISKIIQHHLKNGGISRFKKIPIYLDWCGLECTKDNVDFFSKKFSNHSVESVVKSDFIPGVKEALGFSALRKKNVLVTATPEKDIHTILLKINLLNFFIEIYGSEVDKEIVINKFISDNKYKKKDYLFIGDSESDVKAALKNNIPFLLKVNKENIFLAEKYSLPTVENFLLNQEIDFKFTNSCK